MSPSLSAANRLCFALLAPVTGILGLFLEYQIEWLYNSPLNPYANPLTIFVFLLTAAMPIANEFVLRIRGRETAWLRHCALIGTAASLPLVTVLCLLFLPFVPIALLMKFPADLRLLGLLIFVPYLFFGVFIAQGRALLAAAEKQTIGVPRRVLLMAALSALLSAGIFLVRLAP